MQTNDQNPAGSVFAPSAINWFPGHMAVTRRMIRENLRSVDVVLELLDARIPRSSRNPEIRGLLEDRRSIIVLNKADLADPEKTARWIRALFETENTRVVPMDCKSGAGASEILAAAKELLRDKLLRDREKGMKKPIRAMVVGIPNVGKSTLINRFAGAKKAQAENRPGVTRTKQWVRSSADFELLDMPGVLWPKFEDRTIGENLAMTGAIKDSILPVEEIACLLCDRLRTICPGLFAERYRLANADLEQEPYELFRTVGRKRGFLRGGGEIDEERCAGVLLDEFRSGKIGRITLEEP